MTDRVYFCRLEYLTADGWTVGHAGVNLLHPERYVERLNARGKFGRVTVVDTGEVFQAENIPDPSEICRYCMSTEHHQGECLL